ncbi:MAG: MFS transporter [Natronomonas sp.]
MRDDPITIVSVVSIAHFLSHVFLLAYPPLFPLLADSLGVSTARLGLLVTAIYVPQLFLQLPLGGVIDRIGAKWILVAGLAVTSLAIGASGFVEAYWLLLACAFVSGIGQSVFHPADYALLEAVTESETEGKAFSAHTFGGFAGFAAAPLAIGTIGITIGWQTALIAVGAVGVFAAAGIAVVIDPVHSRSLRRSADAETDPGPADGSDDAILSALAAFVRQPNLLLVFGFYFASMMAIVGLQSFTTVLAVDGYGLDETTANTLLTAHLTATALGVLVGGPLADRLPVRITIVGAFLLAAAGTFTLVVLGASFGSGLIFALLAFVGLLVGIALPSRDKFANSVTDPEAVGKSFGFFFTGLSLGAVIGPALLGWVIDTWTPQTAFVLVCSFLVAATAIVVTAIGLRGDHPKPSPG